MIKIAICDDSAEQAEEFEKYLETLPYKVDTDVFYRGGDLLDYIERQEEKYHLYVLDIGLKDESGVNLARKIRSMDEECLIVFLTGYPGYVYEIFDIEVFDYIVKPINTERMNRLMSRVKERVDKQGRVFYYRFNKVCYGIDADKIYLFQKNCRLVEIHTKEADVLYTYMKMEEVMEQLNSRNFVRISYSCIVNLKYVEEIQGQVVHMTNGMSMNIARNLLKEVKEKHLRYLSEEVWQWSS